MTATPQLVEPPQLPPVDRTKYSYYHLVPKEYRANLKFRRELVELGGSSKRQAEELWLMCARDMLFYVNAFCWIFEPRQAKVMPFLTYDFQDYALDEIDSAIGHHDLVVSKSRDMGASWMCVTVCEHRWHFKDMETFLLVSRKEDLVDKTDDPKSMYWKLDFLHKYQPAWLLPQMERQKMHLKNCDNGSTIDGESTSAETATGDRRAAVIFDEFSKMPDSHKIAASSRDVSRCRIFNFSAYGTGNAAYDLTRKPEFRQLRLHWSLHPEKNKGLYKDPDNGKYRSPWYDGECKRAVNPQEIAQELDIDFLGSSYQFWDIPKLELYERQFCRPPLRMGDVTFDKEKMKFLRFVDTPNGSLQLWRQLDEIGNFQRGDYVFGVDTSFGTGASNSSVSIGDRKSGEKVAEYTSPNLPPHEFAEKIFILAQMFKSQSGEGPYVVWEDNGPGAIVGRRLIELGYRNIYYRKKEKTITRKSTQTPGWASNDETKLLLLTEYRQAMHQNDFINHSIEAVRECKQYIRGSGSEIYHAESQSTIDPTGARENHGDRVIADALCWLGIKETPVEEKEPEPEIPVGSLAWRRERYQRESSKAREEW